MSNTTSNAALASTELMALCHEFYAIGQSIVNRINNESVSNATLNAMCTQIKIDRTAGGKSNSTHVAILAALAGL